MWGMAAWCCMLLGWTACDNDAAADKVPGDGLIQIQPVLSGSLVADGFATGTRAENLPEDSVIVPLPEGTTLWIIAETKDELGESIYTQTSYVVKEVSEGTGVTSLYPCEVDDDGKVVSVDGTPMFISEGTYTFWAVSPARNLGDDNSLSVKNGEELLATDNRYEETEPTTITVSANWTDEDSRIEVIRLNPLFNQTAQLKFTITSEAKWIHSLELLASGVEYSGLQEETENNNWSLTTHLQTDYGMKNGTYRETECVTGKNSDGTHYLEVTTPILPVNAIATPVVVLFNVLINGVPSPFSIMLTEKDFKAGYSYHYKGQVKLQNGVAVIVWQFVEWGTDVVFD